MAKQPRSTFPEVLKTTRQKAIDSLRDLNDLICATDAQTLGELLPKDADDVLVNACRLLFPQQASLF